MDSFMFSTNVFFLNAVLFAVGLLVLIKGSDWFVEAAAYIARHYGLPEIVIGLTLVSIGTSLPEFATDVYAAIKGESIIALGNIIGSNVTNLTLIMGLGIVLIGNINIPKPVLKRDVFIMFAIFIALALMCYLGIGDKFYLSRVDGIILLVLLVAYIVYLINHEDSLEEEMPEGEEDLEKAFKSMSITWVYLVLGLVMIFIGAKLLVDNVVKTANDFNLNKTLVSATIVAFGTTVPEMAVTVTSIMKGKNAIALGNVIGSCIFNIVLILGVSAVICPIPVDKELLYVIIPALLSIALLLIVFMRTGWRLVRWEGFVFLFLYLAFIVYNVIKIRT